ncbi:hypothetical protein [Adhaeribacter aquaticus]|uniref:hypothetical protein n=1 Tax=Adhaeribacter aquaticus TaxID=299567 RepID=UPI000404C7F5|nr:hypothetical protein [Adhaeribacter aquaticus]
MLKLKRIRKYFLSGFIILILFTGCNSDPEPRTELLFASGNNLTTTNRSNVRGGEILSTSIYARTPASNKFQNFKVTYTYDTTDAKNLTTYLDSTLNAEEYAMLFTFSTRALTGYEVWNFEIKDSNNKVYSKRYRITTTSTNSQNRPFYTDSTYFYRKSNVENLQYFSVTDGTVYPGNVVRQNIQIRNKINFYFEQPTPETSPETVNLKSFNNTSFKTTNLTVKEFNSVKTISSLESAYSNATDASNTIPTLKQGQVVAFKTGTIGQEKIGLIKIINFVTAFDRQKNDSILIRMPYIVKVQK